MKAKFYLNVTEKGSVRATKKKVALYTDEIAIAMELDIPDSLFQKPIITGRITVSEDMISPNILEADVAEEIENVLKSVEGVKIELTMPETT